MDGDGIPDEWELQWLPLNASLALLQELNGDMHGPELEGSDELSTLDDDGLSVWEEYLYGTSPFSADTDGDGMLDDWEVEHELDATDAGNAFLDSDSDGLLNVDEHYFGTDPRNMDSDMDGLPDGVEVGNGLNPLDGADALADMDGDGVPNLWEYERGHSFHDIEDVPAWDAYVMPWLSEDDPAQKTYKTLTAAYDSLPVTLGYRATVQLYQGVHTLAPDPTALARKVAYVGRKGISSMRGEEGVILKGLSLTVSDDTFFDGIIFEGGYGLHVAPPVSGTEVRVRLQNCLLRFIQPTYGASLAAQRGAALTNDGGQVVMAHCTVHRCTGFDGSIPWPYQPLPAIANLSGSLSLVNSIIWDDTAPAAPAIRTAVPGSLDGVEIQTSLVQGGPLGSLDADPHLDPNGSLGTTSTACLAVGTPGISQMDLRGQWRSPVLDPDLGAEKWTNEDGDSIPDWWELGWFSSTDLGDAHPLWPDSGATLLDRFLSRYPVPDLTDTDQDGLPDAWEMYYWGNLATGAGDEAWSGMTVGQAFAAALMPAVRDADGDGMGDEWELAHGLNPEDALDAWDDPDGDFLFNREEYEHETSPIDSLSPSSEAVTVMASNPLTQTTTARPARNDYEAVHAAPMLWPWDLVRDTGPYPARQYDDDWDQDGVSNLAEMTAQPPTDPRLPALPDADGDGMTDAWEMAWGLDPADGDEDGNTVSDSEDDADNDGLTNHQEMVVGTNPNEADTDGDGVDDADEIGEDTDPARSNALADSDDTDGDGWSNAVELMAGTNPASAVSQPTLPRLEYEESSTRDNWGAEVKRYPIASNWEASIIHYWNVSGLTQNNNSTTWYAEKPDLPSSPQLHAYPSPASLPWNSDSSPLIFGGEGTVVASCFYEIGEVYEYGAIYDGEHENLSLGKQWSMDAKRVRLVSKYPYNRHVRMDFLETTYAGGVGTNSAPWEAQSSRMVHFELAPNQRESEPQTFYVTAEANQLVNMEILPVTVDFRTRNFDFNDTSKAGVIVDVHSVGSSDLKPIVKFELEKITDDTVKLTGSVRDPVLDNIPTNADWDLEEVVIYIDGEEEQRVALQTQVERSPDALAQRPYDAIIPETTLQISGGGFAEIRVETSPNILGLKGSASGAVSFQRSRNFETNTFGGTTNWLVKFIGSHSSETVDQVTLEGPMMAGALELTEDGPDSNSFTGDGHRVHIMGAPNLTSVVDTLVATIYWNDFASTASSFTTTLTENGSETNEFSAVISVEELSSEEYRIHLNEELSASVINTLTLQHENSPAVTLVETAVDSSQFRKVDDQNKVQSVNLLAPPANDGPLSASFTFGNSNVGLLMRTAVFQPEEGQSGTYLLKIPKWTRGLGWTETFSIDEAVGGESESERGNFPIAIRGTLVPDIQGLRMKGSGQVLYRDSESGYLKTGVLNELHLVGHIFRNEADQFEFVYWDATSVTLKRIPLQESSLDVEVINPNTGDSLGEIGLECLRVTWVDAEGEVLPDGPMTISLDYLLDALEENEYEFPDIYKSWVQVSGANPSTTVRAQSSEILEDFFTLAGPEVSISGHGRIGALTQITEGLFESEMPVIVYSSSYEQEMLTDGQWNQLKAAGILAIHNTVPWWYTTEQGRGGIGAYRYPGTQDHHIFNKWRKSSRAKINGVIFGTNDLDLKFGENDTIDESISTFAADILVDVLTMPVRTERHRSTYTQMTGSWATAVDGWLSQLNVTLPMTAQQTKQLENQIRRAAIEHMWILHKDESGFDLDLLRPHPEKMKVLKLIPPKVKNLMRTPGSTIPYLYDLDSFDSSINLAGASAKSQRWRTIFAGLGKRVGLNTATGAKRWLKRFPWVRVAIVAGFLAQADPAAAMADVLEYSPELCQEILDGTKTVKLDLWHPGERVEIAVMANGEVIREGETWKIHSLDTNGIITKIQDCRVVEIYTAKWIEGEVNADGSQIPAPPATYDVYVSIPGTGPELVPFGLLPDVRWEATLERYLYQISSRPPNNPGLSVGDHYE